MSGYILPEMDFEGYSIRGKWTLLANWRQTYKLRSMKIGNEYIFLIESKARFLLLTDGGLGVCN